MKSGTFHTRPPQVWTGPRAREQTEGKAQGLGVCPATGATGLDLAATRPAGQLDQGACSSTELAGGGHSPPCHHDAEGRARPLHSQSRWPSASWQGQPSGPSRDQEDSERPRSPGTLEACLTARGHGGGWKEGRVWGLV